MKRKASVGAGKQPCSARKNKASKQSYVVADIQSPLFGQEFTDKAAIDAGAVLGDFCLVKGEAGLPLLLQATDNSENYVSDYYKKAAPQLAQIQARVSADMGSRRSVSPPLGDYKKSASPPAKIDMRPHERKAELFSWDTITHLRPAFVPRRICYGIGIFLLHIFLTWATHSDTPPTILAPILVTVLYPTVLAAATRVMTARTRPAAHYVFEFLLAFDMYQLVTSCAILALVLQEAHRLGMLWYPWGNHASISSPLLRFLVWAHYQNRVLELLDTFVRVSQKRIRAYGALHVYMRIVNVWSWYVACRVGGGDVYFITALDALVVSIRFFAFTLSILRWNWNINIDFGMHAPKVTIFKHDHLYLLQIAEFSILLTHACFSLFWGNMPRLTMAMQIFVMVSGLCVFTDFHESRDQLKQATKQYSDGRLIFSFDSSAWLFLYHFGVAMWIEDNIEKQPDRIGYSGSSGGALVAGTLSSDINAHELASFVINRCYAAAGKNPFRLLHQCEIALDTFLPADAHETSTSVLRVLLTKVSRWPPFLMGEVVSRFSSWAELFSCLRASCHIPMFGGFLPYPVPDHGWYYDGLLWNSMFVPWRTFDVKDSVIKISAFGNPTADIYPKRFVIPPWWAAFPPTADVLWGFLALGYEDASDFYNMRERRWGGQVTVKKGDVPANLQTLRALAKKNPRKSRLDAKGLAHIEALQATVIRVWHRSAVLVLLMMLLLLLVMILSLTQVTWGTDVASAAKEVLREAVHCVKEVQDAHVVKSIFAPFRQ